MKPNNCPLLDKYSSPQCNMLQLEVDTAIAVISSGACDGNIKDPSWDTDGSYGME